MHNLREARVENDFPLHVIEAPSNSNKGTFDGFEAMTCEHRATANIARSLQILNQYLAASLCHIWPLMSTFLKADLLAASNTGYASPGLRWMFEALSSPRSSRAFWAPLSIMNWSASSSDSNPSSSVMNRIFKLGLNVRHIFARAARRSRPTNMSIK